MTRWLDDGQQRAWRAWLRAHQRLDVHLARQLQDDAELSISDFAVLVALSEARGGLLRPFELGQALEWEKSRLSHHVTRMHRRGLVERRDCGSDGRGALVAITATGRAAIQGAAPAHAESVQQALFDRLSPAQVQALTEICTTVLDGLDPPACPAGP